MMRRTAYAIMRKLPHGCDIDLGKNNFCQFKGGTHNGCVPLAEATHFADMQSLAMHFSQLKRRGYRALDPGTVVVAFTVKTEPVCCELKVLP